MANTLADGQKVQVQGSSSTYTLHRTGDTYSCTCPAWRNQGAAHDRRTCKHLRAYLGDAVETARVGSAAPARAKAARTATTASAGTKASAGAPPLLLAHKWEDQDPTGWWMSEKLDGIRAYWDGRSFISRLGNTFYAPDWFVAELPTETLDGELWVGRKMFQTTTSIVRSGAQSDAWKQVSYVVFDAPNAPGTFEARLAHAQRALRATRVAHARCLEHVACSGIAHLREELQRIEGLGGEGLMLRRPRSLYEVGRSSSLLKVKTFHDAEATVIGHAPGAGKHKGRLGALIVELGDGTRFNVGTGFSDAERANPPAVGSVITFRYQELSNDGVPRFPTYVGERVDVARPAPLRPAPAARPARTARPAAPITTPVTTTAGGFKVSLIHHGEQKFWEIEVDGTLHRTRFGKVGTTGQTRTVELGSASAARADADKRAQQKRKEGYSHAT